MSDRTVAMLDPVAPRSAEVIRDAFAAEFEVVFVEEDSAQARRRAARDADAVLTLWGPVDAETIAGMRRCQVIQKLGVGIDRVDLTAARDKGVTVLIAAGINAQAVAELAILHMLAVCRNLTVALASARTGRVEKEALRADSYQLFGKTIGIVGLGHIGRALATRLRGFEVELIYHDIVRPERELEEQLGVHYLSFEDLLATADIITVHVPLDEKTRNLIDREALKRIRPGAVLINTARGPIVDQDALVEAVRDRRLLGAGLDVTTEEPLPPTSPLIGLDRVVLTPHIGGAVSNNFPRVVARALTNVKSVLSGCQPEVADIVCQPDHRAKQASR